MDGILGSIMLWSSPTIPRGWMVCDGGKLKIAQNSALFSLIGPKFGGDGKTDFALPDLRGRVPRGSGASTALGDRAGQETVTLTSDTIPAHRHPLGVSSTAGTSTTFSNVILAAAGTAPNTPVPPNIYGPSVATPEPLAATSIVPVTGGQPHENMQPFAVVNFIICVSGHYPSRN